MFSRVAVLFAVLFSSVFLNAQAPSTGDITVRLSQGLDSSTARPNQIAMGVVVKSTNDAVPRGTQAGIALQSSSSNGYTVQLVRLVMSSALVRTASGEGVLAGVSKLGGFLHDANTPKTAASGPRVYLPPNTDIRFTLTDAPPQLVAPATRRAAAPPPPPSHPANTVVDLPAASSGYPPLHASGPAQQGCWWTPFYSEKFGLEAAVQNCADPKAAAKVVDMETGLGLQYQGEGAQNPPQLFVTVLSKPADQPIETAIKQQFIFKLKEPGGRLGCRVVKGYGTGPSADVGPQNGDPNLQAYTVGPTPAYGKQAKFQGEEAPFPCSGLVKDDAIDRFFLYNAAEAKTKFLFFQIDDNAAVFDSNSVHFKAE